MFKKIVTACAAAVLSAGLFAPTTTYAVAPNPLSMQQPAGNAATVYTSVDPNVQLSVELVRQNSMVAGTIKFQGQTFPFVAREQNGQFEGYFEHNGNRLPLQGVIRGNDLGIATNGAQYVLRTTSGGNFGNVNNQPVNNGPVNPLANGGPVHNGPVNNGGLNERPANPIKTIHNVSGNVFNCPVIGGWEHIEDKSSVTVISPDKKSAYGVAVIPNVNADPSQFMADFFRHYGVNDLKVISARNLKPGANERVIEAEVSFTGGDGVKRRGMVIASVFTHEGNRTNGLFIHSACPEEQWNQIGRTLYEIACRIDRVAAQPQRQQPQRPQWSNTQDNYVR
jgi:hypothetical protein